MSKKNHNNDISPEELLEQLRSSIELDETGMTAEIDIPTIPEVNQMSAQERFMARRNAAIEAEAADEIAPEEPEAEEPVVIPEEPTPEGSEKKDGGFPDGIQIV